MHYTPRLIEKQCQQAVEKRKILVLLGPRQTGKTTLVKALVSHLPDNEKLILNLDDPFLRERLTSSERGLQKAIEDRSGKPFSEVHGFTLVIDEAQKEPALFERIKSLYDACSERVTIILTGSSALEIHDPVAETLAGRLWLVHLLPFTLSEGFVHARQDDPKGDVLPELMASLLTGRFDRETFDALVERGVWSGREKRGWLNEMVTATLFPEPVIEERPERWIRDYLATYLEKDIQSLASVGHVSLFRDVLRQVAARVGQPMKWETAAQEVGTTSITMRKYIGLLQQTLVATKLEPFAMNPVKRVIKAPKINLVDVGLLWGLRGFEDRRLLEATGMLGTYFEVLAINELAKWCSLEPTAPNLRFWHKTEISEVDLVVSNRGYHIPFEIKLGSELKRRWLRGLDAFDQDHAGIGLHIPYRIVLHMGEPAILDERSYAIPLWMLC